MTYQELLENARKATDSRCKHCKICDGRACGGVVPGPGAKGTGSTFNHSYDVLQEIKILPEVIYKSHPCTAETDFFGIKLSSPPMVSPILSVQGSWGLQKSDEEYTAELLQGCKDAGILAFTGDGPNPATFFSVEKPMREIGCCIPTFKPRTLEDAKRRIEWAEENGAVAISIDIDMLGNGMLRAMENPIHAMDRDELGKICELTKLPMIIRGVLTVHDSVEALQAGADAICVTNHGGRSQDGLPAAPEFLPHIADAIGGRIPILVDGAVRSGVDMFRMLALGADYVMVGRPFVTAVCGGGAEGVKLLADKYKGELIDTMYMTDSATVKDISGDKIFWPRMGYAGK